MNNNNTKRFMIMFELIEWSLTLLEDWYRDFNIDKYKSLGNSDKRFAICAKTQALILHDHHLKGFYELTKGKR